MSAVWKKSFIAFVGPGYAKPSEQMQVDDSEASAILAALHAQIWLEAAWTGSGRQLGYRICNARREWTSALFHGDRIVGFYHGSYLWIAAPHRAQGLSTPLILAAADHRGGSCMPPGVGYQGYTAIGLAAHRAAYRHAIQQAQRTGRLILIRPSKLIEAPASGAAAVPPHEAAQRNESMASLTWFDLESA